MAKFAPHMGNPFGDPQSSPQHRSIWIACFFKENRTRNPCGPVLWAGLRVSMWIAHMGGKFRYGLLKKSLKSQQCSNSIGASCAQLNGLNSKRSRIAKDDGTRPGQSNRENICSNVSLNLKWQIILSFGMIIVETLIISLTFSNIFIEISKRRFKSIKVMIDTIWCC